MSIAKVNGQFSLQEIADIVECPVCNEISDSCDFLQCSNGHIGCQSCLSRLAICPVCRVKLSQKGRTISVEKLSGMLHELRHVETSEMNLQHTKLSEIFSCEMCKFVPTRKPIFQCSEGHWFCKACSNTNCSRCKESNKVNWRSIFSEKILSKLVKRCRFSRLGCQELITELSEHENIECIYRDIACIFPSCNSAIPFYKLSDHLKEHLNSEEENLGIDEHKQIGHVILPDFKQGITHQDFKHVFYVRLDGTHHFLVQCNVSQLRQSCFFWISYVGPPDEAKQFRFESRMFKEGCESELNMIGPVVSIEMDEEDIRRSNGLDFEVYFSEIKCAWGKDFSLEVSVFRPNSAFEKAITLCHEHKALFYGHWGGFKRFPRRHLGFRPKKNLPAQAFIKSFLL